MTSDDLNDVINIDNGKLIKEMKQRSILYDKRHKSYSNMALKREAWREVCQNVYQDWMIWNKVQKQKGLTDVQKRWHNLRTCFQREVRCQAMKSGYKRRRRYVFYNALLFLKGDSPHVDVKNENEDEQNEDHMEENREELEEVIMEADIQETSTSRNTGKRNENEGEIILPDPLQAKKRRASEDPIDQDFNFALSLVPMLRSLPLNTKLGVQIEILKLFQQVTENN